jgi:hypothetical protein
VGGTQVFSAAARNAEGKPILGLNIQFIVTSGTPNTPAPLLGRQQRERMRRHLGRQHLGVQSRHDRNCLRTSCDQRCVQRPTTVYVHQHVDNIQIFQTENPPPQYDCFYQGQTWDFEAIAYSGNPPVDISNSVGP